MALHLWARTMASRALDHLDGGFRRLRLDAVNKATRELSRSDLTPERIRGSARW